MKKSVRLLLGCLLMLITLFAGAQSMLPVEGKAPAYYITYKVQPSETLTGIGKTFGASVGDIMRINGMHANSKLAVREDIKIPLNAKNMRQSREPNSIALVHPVQKGETLYRISLNHNKVPIDMLKMWNGLDEKPLEVGQDLIIGYLVPNGNVNMPVIATESPRKPAPKEVKETAKAQAETTTEPATTPAVQQPEETAKTPVQEPAAQTQTPVQQPVEKPVEKKPEQQPAIKSTPKTIDLSNTNADGYFAPQFGKDVEGRDLRSASGLASTFKTASGWSDKKYYILMNDIPPGSIVKVSSGDKAVYAKVLWGLGTMKENEGLNYRISNAAASALNIGDAKFEIVVVYYE